MTKPLLNSGAAPYPASAAPSVHYTFSSNCSAGRPIRLPLFPGKCSLVKSLGGEKTSVGGASRRTFEKLSVKELVLPSP